MAAELEAREIAPNVGDYTSIIRLEAIQMAFGAVQALRDIDLAIGRNEIVGLIGDNGAGKSTLIKVMTGVVRPTGGAIWFRDRRSTSTTIRCAAAHELGIETVYQEKSLGEKQPLWRNFFVGRQITNRWGFIDVAESGIANHILRTRSAFAASASTPTARWRSCRAASARASRSAGRCTSKKT